MLYVNGGLQAKLDPATQSEGRRQRSGRGKRKAAFFALQLLLLFARTTAAAAALYNGEEGGGRQRRPFLLEVPPSLPFLLPPSWALSSSSGFPSVNLLPSSPLSPI